jgi:predicted transcriptional regulator
MIRSMQQEIAERTKELAESADKVAADKVELERLGTFQRELADQARELIERMNEENQGGGS